MFHIKWLRPQAARRANRIMRFGAAFMFCGALLTGTQSDGAAAFETSAKQMILVDDTTGAVMLEKNSDQPMFPASMSKLMTLYVVFERLTEGSLSFDAQFRVSEKAWRMGGSKMFVELNSRVSVNDLLRGVIVQSGNDACIVLAEGIAGSEAQFVELMNNEFRRPKSHLRVVTCHSNFIIIIPIQDIDHTKFTLEHTSE